MVTKQDLVEAYSFSRRRLVTAFVSGAAGAYGDESARPGRIIVGGLALAGLLLAGAAIVRTLSPSVPESCSHDPGVIGSREIGANYDTSAGAAQVTGPGR
jgi:hypothetical protein